MKLEFTKEQHLEFINNHFQVLTAHTVNENSEIYYILPSKEEYTKDDQLIARIQAEKFGFKVKDSYLVEDYKPENKTFCANYERDNNLITEDSESYDFSEKVVQILESEPNDMSAGELIRKEYKIFFNK
jgi:hypothetical protein